MKRNAVALRFLGVCCVVLCLITGRAAAAEPAGPAGQALTQEVKGGVLAGTLMLPAATGKMPVALIIAGSGPTDRDGNSTVPGFRSDSLKLLAAALAQQGIASLRYDKRGIGASRAAMPSESALRFDDYVDDAARWLATLKADPRFSNVVVIGHSEGALIGMLAAANAGADGFVSLAGIADGFAVVLRKQLAGKMAPAQLAESERILTALEHGATVADVPPGLAMLFRPSVQPYLISVMKYAPAERFATLRIPALIVQGETDVQVGVDQAVKLKAAKPDALLVTIPGMNHALKAATSDIAQQKAAYGDPALPLHPQLAPAIVGFVRSLKQAN
ncbi:alpha/beta hydrolase [Massilia sp. 9096]|uniref:alpha/beta hydrolase n=1 Tax=Massilia sp. 9096 TaxID=1500894 RepID=UPI00068DE989|nr:alpha/beta fold hydrolase [Massilia sp. 9096]